MDKMDATTQSVYQFICRYKDRKSLSPSLREIANACYISVSSVIRHLDRLEAWGYIERKPNTARAIVLLRHP